MKIANKKMFNALKVIIENEKIKKFLEENDPKCLEQCENAINEKIDENLRSIIFD